MMGQTSSQPEMPASMRRPRSQIGTQTQRPSQREDSENGAAEDQDQGAEHESARTLLQLSKNCTSDTSGPTIGITSRASKLPTIAALDRTQSQNVKRKRSGKRDNYGQEVYPSVCAAFPPKFKHQTRSSKLPKLQSGLFSSKMTTDHSMISPASVGCPLNESQITLDDIASDEDDIAELYRGYEEYERHMSIDSQIQGAETDVTSPLDWSTEQDEAIELLHTTSQHPESLHNKTSTYHSEVKNERNVNYFPLREDLEQAEEVSRDDIDARRYNPNINFEAFDQALGGFNLDAADPIVDPPGTDASKKRKGRSNAKKDTVYECAQELDTGEYTPERTPELDIEALDHFYANHENGADIFGKVPNFSHSSKPTTLGKSSAPSNVNREPEAASDSGGASPGFEITVPDQYMLYSGTSNADAKVLPADQEHAIDPVLMQDNVACGHEEPACSDRASVTSDQEPRAEYSPSQQQRVSKVSPSLENARIKRVTEKFKVKVSAYVSIYPLVETQPDGRYQSPPPQQQSQRRSDGLFSSRAPLNRQVTSSDRTAFSQLRNSSELSNTTSKKSEGKKAATHRERSSSPCTKKAGIYSERDVTLLEDYRDEYLIAEDIDGYQFNDMIHAPMQGNPKVRQMWSEIRDILPNRDAKQLTRFCRRRFHNFHARGVWTAEEDQILMTAVEEKGKAWTTIGKHIDRYPEDCRDRWRNYLVNAETRNREHWTEAEVRNLASAIDECVHLLRHDRKVRKALRYEGREVPESGEESGQEKAAQQFVNWQSVSDRMGEHGGGRSRLQCSMKWSQLKQKIRKAYLREARLARLDPSIQQLDTTARKGSRNSGWRLRKGARRAENMKSGDKHDLLLALTTCSAIEEENIPWLSLGADDFKTKWTSHEKRGAWLRLRGEIPNADNEDYHEIANRLYTKLIMTEGDQVEERWDPENDHKAIEPQRIEPGCKSLKEKATKISDDEKRKRKKERQKVKNAKKRVRREAKKRAMTEEENIAQKRKRREQSGSLSKTFVDSNDEESDPQEASGTRSRS